MCQPSLPFKCSYQMEVSTSTSLSPYLNHHVGWVWYDFWSKAIHWQICDLCFSQQSHGPLSSQLLETDDETSGKVLVQFSKVQTLLPSRYRLAIMKHFKCSTLYIYIKPKGGKYHCYRMLQKKNSDKLRQSYCDFGEWMLNLSENECTAHCKSVNVFCSWCSYGTITSTLSKQN